LVRELVRDVVGGLVAFCDSAAVEDVAPMCPGAPDEAPEDHERRNSKDEEANYLRVVLKQGFHILERDSQAMEPTVSGFHAWVCFCDDVSSLSHGGAWWSQFSVVCDELVGICKYVCPNGV
jgi:hypothetical protein